MTDKISMKQMCEKINEANILINKDGSNPTPKEIFNYSASGELFMIFEWYEIAKHLEGQEIKVQG